MASVRRFLMGVLLVTSGGAAAADNSITESLVRRVEQAVTLADSDLQAGVAALRHLLQRNKQPNLARAYIVQQKAGLHIRGDEIAVARDDLVSVLQGQPVEYAQPLRL